MGEMMADTLRDEIEIGKATDNIFKTSISFGRFENDLLSWERWSSFSQNKYLEEVEKCSTPGSVAEKKAYFEAHYKKIAARKAELLDQEQSMGTDSWRSDSSNHGDPSNNGCGGAKLEFGSLDVGGISKSVEAETNSTCVGSGTQINELNQDGVGVNCQRSFGEKVKEEEEVDGFLDIPRSNKLDLPVWDEEEDQLRKSQVQLEEMPVLSKEENLLRNSLVQLEAVTVSVKEHSQFREAQGRLEEMSGLVKKENKLEETQGQLEEISGSVKEENQLREAQVPLAEMSASVKEEKDSTGLQTPLEDVPVSVQEESQFIGSKDQLEKSQKLGNRKRNSQVNKVKDAKLKPEKESQKVKSRSIPNRTMKDPAASTLARTKKSPASASTPARTTKTVNTLRPRASKPAPAAPLISTSGTSTRKENSPSLPRNKTPPAVRSKRSTPNSLHMSFSLEPENSTSASPSITRRSFIMENMGDKEIVKRAFRTFQNNFDRADPSNESVSSSPLQVPVKRTERSPSPSVAPRKDKEGVKNTMGRANSQRGQVTGRSNSVSAGPAKAVGDRQTSAKATPSTFGLRNDQKRKELIKKPEKSTAKEVERQMSPMEKEKKEADMKKLRQSPIKATTRTDKNRGQGVSKALAKKVDAK